MIKDSKQEHDIGMRKKREEEVAILSQIPEYREQQIKSIINNADQMK